MFYQNILVSAIIALSSLQQAAASPTPMFEIDNMNSLAGGNRFGLPVNREPFGDYTSNNGASSSKKPSTKKSNKPKSNSKREEPSIFEVGQPLQADTAAPAGPSPQANKPVRHIILDAGDRNALAGGDTLLGFPENEQLVFVNKRSRLSQRSARFQDVDLALAAMHQ